MRSNRSAFAFRWILVACVVAAGCSVLRPGRHAPLLTPEQQQNNVDSFEYVWSTIRDRHWDPTLNGLDWQAIHDELLPGVAAARTMPDARAIMDDLIGRLGQSHFGIIPAQLYEDLAGPSGEGGGNGETGIDVRVIDGHALVTRVDPGSQAEQAGVKPGWEILAIDGKDIPPRLERLAKEFESKTYANLILARAVTTRLQGDLGKTVRVRLLEGMGRKIEMDVPFGEPRGRLVSFGNLPPQRVWIETCWLPDSVGYIGVNLFLDPSQVMTAYNKAMESYLDAAGVIVDLRGNGGGLGAMAMGMAGWFIEASGQRLGTMHMRDSELKFVISPRPETYAGPVAVLIDGLSASTAEIMAGGLRDLGRVRTFGMRTAGAALPSAIERLPNGDGFQYAFANYISEGGQVLEGAGVLPDVEAPPARDALLAGRDTALDAAVAWIGQARGASEP